MKAVRISEDIVPVSDFKAQAAELLKRVTESGQPLVITQNGKAAGVLLSPAEFDRLSERASFVAAVQEGLADATGNRTRSHAEVVASILEAIEAYLAAQNPGAAARWIARWWS